MDLNVVEIEKGKKGQEFEASPPQNTLYNGRKWRNLHPADAVDLKFINYPRPGPVWISPVRIHSQYGMIDFWAQPIGSNGFEMHLDHFEHRSEYPDFPPGFPSTEDGLAGFEVRFTSLIPKASLEGDVEINLDYSWFRTGTKITEAGLFEALNDGFKTITTKKTDHSINIQFKDPIPMRGHYAAIFYLKTESDDPETQPLLNQEI